MKKLTIIVLGILFSLSLSAQQSSQSVYDFEVLDIDGNQVSLDVYKGNVLLIVNVASKCGFTYQYEDLENLYRQYEDEGLVVLGFPSNDFLFQEPGSNEDIKEFCTSNFDVTFPLFSKVKVTGRNKTPLYEFLTSKETNPQHSGRITWNFNKFLIDRDGNIINRFGSNREPLSDEVVESIKELL